jgi:hypothetical protein
MAFDDEEAPLDPAAERLRRKLARLLLVSGGIMLLGFIAVFAAIVYKLGVLGEDEPAAASVPGFAEPVEARIGLPAGARLLDAELDGERALLTIEGDGGSRELVYVDLATGRVLGRYAIETE